MIGGLTFAPLLSAPWLGCLALIALLASLPALLRRARGGLPRTFGFLLLLGILAGPAWRAQTRRPLPDIALMIIDQSQSMSLGNRAALAERAAAGLHANAGSVELRAVTLPPASDGGTALFAALRGAENAIPPAQLAGVIAITDGEIADPPPGLPATPPLTALITAAHEETDRELRLFGSPGYGLVGQTVPLRLAVLDHGVADAGARVAITVTEDGKLLARPDVAIGAPVTLDLPVRHAGPNIVQVQAAALPGAVTARNDQAIFTLNGIERRLNILLVSGSPDLGERSWRLLLKSDPATQLVHFTILRTPGEAIYAAPSDLALVPFPVEQLFATDLAKFDLIIFDRFNASDLLPDRYLANIAMFVENGGALFAELGPEFATAQSLAFSSLGGILPARPGAGTLVAPFSPSVTPLGARHPVTAPFAGARLSPWFRMESATPVNGDVLMTGAGGAPLLILGNAGRGRVGMLLSDQFWLWTRGGVHAGPALPLLRRIVHWLLREPALEAESLSAHQQGNTLVIDRQTLSATNPGTATVTAPDGTVATVPLVPIGPGRYEARVPVMDEGVWKVRQGTLAAFAANPPANTEEYQDLAATATILAPRATRVVWLGQTAAPPLAELIRPRHASEVIGLRLIPLLPPLPTTLLALALLSAAWWRESG